MEPPPAVAGDDASGVDPQQIEDEFEERMLGVQAAAIDSDSDNDSESD